MRLRKEGAELLPEDIDLIASVSDSLAHPVRIQIFRFIMSRNAARQTVCNKDVVNEFNYSQATISQHIKRLAASGLIQVKKEERFSTYFVNIGVLGRYVDLVKKFE